MPCYFTDDKAAKFVSESEYVYDLEVNGGEDLKVEVDKTLELKVNAIGTVDGVVVSEEPAEGFKATTESENIKIDDKNVITGVTVSESKDNKVTITWNGKTKDVNVEVIAAPADVYDLIADVSAVTLFAVDADTEATINDVAAVVDATAKTATVTDQEAGEYDVVFTVTVDGEEQTFTAKDILFDEATAVDDVITVALTDADFEAPAPVYTLVADVSEVTLFAVDEDTMATINGVAAVVDDTAMTATVAEQEAGTYDVVFTVTGEESEQTYTATGIVFDAATAEEGVITVNLTDDDFAAEP